MVYTVLRVALFLAVWLTLELITPIAGLWAIVLALLISGVLSLFLLDRQRNRVGSVATGFFGRINDRIDAAARAEDDDSSDVVALPGPIPATGGEASGQGEQGAEGEAVDEQQHPGLLQGGDEGRAERPS